MGGHCSSEGTQMMRSIHSNSDGSYDHGTSQNDDFIGPDEGIVSLVVGSEGPSSDPVT